MRVLEKRQNFIRTNKRGARFRHPLQVMSYFKGISVLNIGTCRLPPGYVLLRTTHASYFLYMSNEGGSLRRHSSVVLKTVTIELELLQSTEMKEIIFYHKYCSFRFILCEQRWKVTKWKKDSKDKVKNAIPEGYCQSVERTAKLIATVSKRDATARKPLQKTLKCPLALQHISPRLKSKTH